MRILALETSSREASVALLQGHQIMQQATLDAGQRTAQWLAPTIDRLWQLAGWAPTDVELVAVTHGPGSFTGLRVGVTTAKTLAYAVGASLLGVNTLEVIARQARLNARHDRVWAVIDAQRQQLFAALFHTPLDSTSAAPIEIKVVDADRWLSELTPGQAVTGPGLGRLQPQIPGHVAVVNQELWTPQAVAVGRIAYERFLAGQRDDPWKLAPLYVRQSAAEEKL